ncbi:hypothetical protein BJX96DRAFT_156426 [Aspergillus floccosus]
MADPFSIIQTVDLCLRWGATLVRICSSIKNAETDIAERLLRVKNYWIRVEVQLKLVQSIADTLDPDHQKVQNETLELLVSKLRIAVGRIESVTKGRDFDSPDARVRRWKYALFQQKIDGAIEDLQLWQQIFDPSWYLIMKTAASLIDVKLGTFASSTAAGSHTPITSAQALRKALDPAAAGSVRIFLPEDGIRALYIQDIPFCSAQLAQRGNPEKALILEKVDPDESFDVKQFERDVRDLAKKLVHCDPFVFGLLNCKGVVRHYDGGVRGSVVLTSFTIVFRTPPGLSQPRSLRSCIRDVQKPDSLSDRVRLANELARSVSYVHTFGLVHKNVRPETVLLLNGKESSVGSLFLIGFDTFRKTEGKTSRRGVSAWEQCLYQHSSRTGPIARHDYVMQHDIYSLGVCLLEIGLWTSFVEYDEQGSPRPASILGDDFSMDMKELLVSLAQGELRSIMGTMYSEVVVTCLTSLDPDNVDFGDESEFQDEDGIQVGVRYIEKVASRLQSICV